MAEVSGSGHPKLIGNIRCVFWQSFMVISINLARYAIVFFMLNQKLKLTMEVFEKYMQKPLYSYNHASISYSIHNGPIVLTTPIWIVSFESLSYGCSTRYFKSNIFEYSGNPKLSKGGT